MNFIKTNSRGKDIKIILLLTGFVTFNYLQSISFECGFCVSGPFFEKNTFLAIYQNAQGCPKGNQANFTYLDPYNIFLKEKFRVITMQGYTEER